ncbi:alpha-amylase [Elizabethkingia anophelis]|uniref:alpha-amylase n=1 Tax=Elizabethkingia anophelis TaxID=1117645 RepID=UPI00099B099D|nr:alpha-amylase [Elizabethkingia anophelis]MCT4013681.1 alpha-amylase [Elizabethkingia anophelis]MDV3899435.1 alpha-amylase [Elizabethkingia anophelis]OPC53976.1 alpha-amylase [Elizabethkingia anophelis]
MNGTMLQSFHWYTDGDSFLWKNIQETADYLKDIGITAVWLPPAYKCASGAYSVGYDPYDLFDLGEFNQKGSVPTKYGSKDDYLTAIKCLKENAIQVIVDVVLNHKAGGDELEEFQVVEVNTENRNEVLSEPFNIQSYTKFNFPERNRQYSEFIWDFTCFSGVEYAEGVDGEHIYRVLNEHSDDWDKLISDEKGNYDFLMSNDINFRNPNVVGELDYWGRWYYEQIGYNGVRLDAIKHITPSFFKDWLYKLREATEENIFAVGEYWAPNDLPILEKYIEVTEGCMSLFDAPLQHQFYLASNQGADYDLSKIFDGTLVQSRPDKAVTLVDNHDTQPLQQLEAPVEHWFKPIAYALILLRSEGYPCIFYPDLFGAHYVDKDKEGNDTEIFLEQVKELEVFLKIRQNNVYGLQRNYLDDPDCIGWTLEGNDISQGCAVIISNNGPREKIMEIGARYAGKSFYDILKGVNEHIEIDKNGYGKFSVSENNISVWVML